jgi:hypothetical protein
MRNKANYKYELNGLRNKPRLPIFAIAFAVSTVFAGQLNRPEVQRVSPQGGTIAGGLIQIDGKNFITQDNQDLYVVIIDRNNFKVSQQAGGDNERLYVQAPDNMSSGPITLQVIRRSGDGSLVQSNLIPYSISGPPRIIDVTPMQGPPESLVTISGRQFGDRQGSSYVLFVGEMKNTNRGSTRANVLAWSDSKVQVVVPPELASGSCDVRLVKVDPESHKGLLTEGGDESRYLVTSSAY